MRNCGFACSSLSSHSAVYHTMPIPRRRKATLCITISLCLAGYVALWNLSLHAVVIGPAPAREASILAIDDAPSAVIDRELLEGQHKKRSTQQISNRTIADKLSSSFSACLLVMDDNHFLIEWLAYHYHVLPLRHLIVAVDPRSQTSPQHILEQWNSMINITVWSNDSDYIMNATELAEAEEWVAAKFANDRPSAALIRHRARQRLFYYHCLQEHKTAGRTYTLLTDSDEFLTVNYDTVRAVYGDEETKRIAPAIVKPGSVIQLLENERKQHPESNYTNLSPCIQIPRSRFGAVETPGIQASVPTALLHDVNASQLTTLRWRHHANALNYQQNRISKVILDVSLVNDRHFRPVDSIHRPVKQYCTRRKLHIRADKQLLLIHHYLGSWEQYNYRQDSRAGNERSRTMYNKAAKLDQGASDMLTPWLKGFVESVGAEKARYLLKNVGRLEPRASSAMDD